MLRINDRHAGIQSRTTNTASTEPGASGGATDGDGGGSSGGGGSSDANENVLYYGNVVQLQHVSSGLFLACGQEAALKDINCRSIKITAGSSACYFRIKPKLAYRREGTVVYYDDEILLESVNVKGHFVHSSPIAYDEVIVELNTRLPTVLNRNLRRCTRKELRRWLDTNNEDLTQAELVDLYRGYYEINCSTDKTTLLITKFVGNHLTLLPAPRTRPALTPHLASPHPASVHRRYLTASHTSAVGGSSDIRSMTTTHMVRIFHPQSAAFINASSNCEKHLRQRAPSTGADESKDGDGGGDETRVAGRAHSQAGSKGGKEENRSWFPQPEDTVIITKEVDGIKASLYGYEAVVIEVCECPKCGVVALPRSGARPSWGPRVRKSLANRSNSLDNLGPGKGSLAALECKRCAGKGLIEVLITNGVNGEDPKNNVGHTKSYQPNHLTLKEIWAKQNLAGLDVVEEGPKEDAPIMVEVEHGGGGDEDGNEDGNGAQEDKAGNEEGKEDEEAEFRRRDNGEAAHLPYLKPLAHDGDFNNPRNHSSKGGGIR